MNPLVMNLLQAGPQLGQSKSSSGEVSLSFDAGENKLDFLQALTEQLGLDVPSDKLEAIASGQEMVANIPLEALQNKEGDLDILAYLQGLTSQPEFKDLDISQENLESMRAIVQKLQLNPKLQNLPPSMQAHMMQKIQQAVASGLSDQGTFAEGQADILQNVLQDVVPAELQQLKAKLLQDGKFLGDRLSLMVDQLNLLPSQSSTAASSPSQQMVQQAIQQLQHIQQVASDFSPQYAMEKIDVHLDNQRWGELFNQRMVMLANQRVQTASIQLDPPDLGPLDVRIQVDHDKANVIFTSQHAVVRDAVEQALPRLREMMQDSGLDLSNVDVSDQSMSQQQQDSSEDVSDRYQAHAEGISEQEDQPTTGQVTTVVSTSLVDYYA